MVRKILTKLKMKWNVSSLRKCVRASIFANFSSGLESTVRVTLGFIVDRSVKARLNYLLRTINSEESLKVNGGNSPFIKGSHSRWRMKEVGHGQFLFAFDESSKLNNVLVNKSVTAWSSSVNYGCFFCLLSGWFEMEERPHTIGLSFFKQFP